MGKFKYDKEKHGKPFFTYNLNDFYFITENNKLMIFPKFKGVKKQC